MKKTDALCHFVSVATRLLVLLLYSLVAIYKSFISGLRSQVWKMCPYHNCTQPLFLAGLQSSQLKWLTKWPSGCSVCCNLKAVNIVRMEGSQIDAWMVCIKRRIVLRFYLM